MADHALVPHLGEGADLVLDRGILRPAAVQVVQVDPVNAQAPGAVNRRNSLQLMGSTRWPRGHGLAKSGSMAGRTVRRPGQRPITPQVAWTSRTAPSRKSRSNFLRVALARGETELDNMRATNMQSLPWRRGSTACGNRVSTRAEVIR